MRSLPLEPVARLRRALFPSQDSQFGWRLASVTASLVSVGLIALTVGYRRVQGIRADAGQSRGAQSGELDRQPYGRKGKIWSRAWVHLIQTQSSTRSRMWFLPTVLATLIFPAWGGWLGSGEPLKRGTANHFLQR